MVTDIANHTIDYFVPLLFWFTGLILLLRMGKLFAAVATTVGTFGTLLENTMLTTVALVLLPLALWLEAVAREQIYSRFLGGGRDKS